MVVKRKWLLRPRPLKIRLKLRREVSPLILRPRKFNATLVPQVNAVVDVVLLEEAEVAVERLVQSMKGPRLKVRLVVVEEIEAVSVEAAAEANVLDMTVPLRLLKMEITRALPTTTEVTNKFMVTRENPVKNTITWIVNQELAMEQKT